MKKTTIISAVLGFILLTGLLLTLFFLGIIKPSYARLNEAMMSQIKQDSTKEIIISRKEKDNHFIIYYDYLNQGIYTYDCEKGTEPRSILTSETVTTYAPKIEFRQNGDISVALVPWGNITLPDINDSPHTSFFYENGNILIKKHINDTDEWNTLMWPIFPGNKMYVCDDVSFNIYDYDYLYFNEYQELYETIRLHDAYDSVFRDFNPIIKVKFTFNDNNQLQLWSYDNGNHIHYIQGDEIPYETFLASSIVSEMQEKLEIFTGEIAKARQEEKDNAICFNDLDNSTNNTFKERFKIGTRYLFSLRLEFITTSYLKGYKYLLINKGNVGLSSTAIAIYTNDERFAQLDYPTTVFFEGIYNGYTNDSSIFDSSSDRMFYILDATIY